MNVITNVPKIITINSLVRRLRFLPNMFLQNSITAKTMMKVSGMFKATFW